MTYIRTGEGWLYLAVVLDLYSRAVVGWAMHHRMHQELVHAALTMAVARRKPTGEVLLDSDRASQYCAFDYQNPSVMASSPVTPGQVIVGTMQLWKASLVHSRQSECT